MDVISMVVGYSISFKLGSFLLFNHIILDICPTTP